MTRRKPQFELDWTQDRAGNLTGKVTLPGLPPGDDLAANCEWLTVVFNFDLKHPIIGGELLGVEGTDVGVRLFRRAAHDEDVPDLLFRDAKAIYRPQQLGPMLGFSRIAVDGVLPTYTGAQCAQIAEAVRRVATTRNTITEEEQIIGVLTSLIERAEVKDEFTIWGTTEERFEAIDELRRDPMLYQRPVCLIDRLKTDHYVFAASEFQYALKQELGPQRHGGWKLAAELVGWQTLNLQGWGHKESGKRPHRHRYVITGTLPEEDEPPDPDEAEEYDPALIRKIPGKQRKRRR
jgi:hypothetical protein